MSAAVERLSCAEDAVQTHLLCISFWSQEKAT